ncbi:MAG: ABC transporter permease [Planctomycetota bacterium]
MYKIFIAFRYLTSRPISLVSIIGILLSVGALIVVVSVMSGFLRETKAYIRGTMSDIVVTPIPYIKKFPSGIKMAGYPDFGELKEAIQSVPGVTGVAPRFVRPALLRRSDGVDPLKGSSRFSDLNFTKVLGIDVEQEREVSAFDDFLKKLDTFTAGVEKVEEPFFIPMDRKNPKYFSRDFPSILIGEDRLIRMGLTVGDVVTLATLDESALEKNQSLEGQDIQAFEKKFFVSGAFRSGNHQFDFQNVIIELEAAREWVDTEDEVSEVYVAVDDYERQGTAIKNQIKAALDRKDVYAEVETWEEVHSIFLGAVENERTILGVILGFFILIATFNVFATISMMVTDKTKDIGILVSMGATSVGIMNTFVLCGLFMWLIGSILGTIAGYLFAANINDIKDFIENLFNIEVFRSDVYSFTEIPVELSPVFISVIVLVTFVMCLFFSLLPSLRASWMDPVKALRHE